ncbi:MAG: LytR C-terminal domain-containing protein [Acidimicrobiales bacterium]
MTGGRDPSQPRGTTKRARAQARRRARTGRGSDAHHAPFPPDAWTVPSLASGCVARDGGRVAAPAPVAATIPGIADDVVAPAPVTVPPPRSPDQPREGKARHGRAEKLRRSRRLVLAVMTVLVMTGGGLVAVGWRQVRGSTAGDYVDPSLQPDDPGYAAFVTPTPTMLVLLRTTGGELGGAALLALQPGDEGGAVIVMPSATQALVGDTPVSFASAYAEGGAAGARSLVEVVTSVAVHETVEIDSRRWETLLDPVGSLTMRLDAPVAEWSVGMVTVEPADMGRFLVAREPDQSGLSRTARQEEFWRAWLEQVASGGDDAVAGELDSGLGRFVRSLAVGADVDGLAVAVTIGETGEEFAIDETLATEQLARSIPYPQSPAPGVRPRIRLLNGTSDAGLTAEVAELLVGDGAEITISGNANSFDEPTTRIIYAGSTLRSTASGYRALLGIGEVEPDPSGQDADVVDEPEQIDVTIILGADAPGAIRR